MTNSKDTDLDVTKLISNMGKSIGESEINSLSLDAQKSTIELQEQINSASESLLNVKKPVLAKQDSPEENAEPEIKHKTLEEAMSDLNELTGMKEVKKQINELTQLIKINKLRKEQGIDGSDMSHHLLFLGNPGTGKSTVSRIVADIYWNLGVVEKGQLIET
ncbi:MAG: hypothetical protein LBN03_02010 [Bifidobacteriaceae bacterium]|jgi:SpoVK/Ycf46/Vps4 family AAA+-type ATPase|nr:hypothetical protein [Bifidobacteriaceae bacterium]